CAETRWWLDRQRRLPSEQAQQLAVVGAEPPRAATVEHLQHPQGLLVALHRHGQDRAGYIAGAFGHITGKARVTGHVAELDRLARSQHPPGDPLTSWDAHAHHYLGAGARGGDKLQVLTVLVDQR